MHKSLIDRKDSASSNHSNKKSLIQAFISIPESLLFCLLFALPSVLQAQTPLINDGSVPGEIAVVGEVDEFVFTANAGEAVHIRMVETGLDTNFSPYISLYNPDGTLEQTINGGSTVAALDCYSTGSCRLEQTGTYTILVQDDGDDYTGSYRIHFSHLPYADENGPLKADGVVTGTIGLGDIDVFTFDANANEAVHIRMVERGADTNFSPYVWLYNPDGTLEQTINGGSTVAALDCYSTGSCRLNQTGTYRMVVQDDGNDYRGNYKVHFSHMPYAAENGRLENNGAVIGKLSLGDVDSFTFDANANEAVHVRMVERGEDTNFSPYIWLYNPDGTLEQTINGGSTVAALDCYSTGSCRLEQTGTYTILVQDDGDDYAGKYRIHFSHMPYATESGPLVNDGVVTDKIGLGDIDAFTFDANAGEAVHIRMVETGNDTNFSPYIWLYNPDGTLEQTINGGSTVAALDCYSTGSCQLNQTGTYRLLVQDDGDDYLGNYEIHFSHMPYASELGHLSPGGAVSGQVTSGDIDSMVFYAEAGDVATITVQETNVDTLFSPYIWLYNPDGTLERTVNGDNMVASLSCSPTGSCQLNQTGTYRIVVQDDGDFYPGDYQVSFAGPAQPPEPTGDFIWPLSRLVPTVSQDHSCRGETNGCVLNTRHHAGLDLTPNGNGKGVFASAGGSIVLATTSCQDNDPDCGNGFGNTMILDHGSGIFSQYSHLQPGTIAKTSGFVTQGEKIGVAGQTGDVTGLHLHWELKRHGKLTDGTGQFFAYTPTHPDNYGYIDPWSQLASTKISPVVVQTVFAAGQNVRRGPGTQYPVMTEINVNQRFVAFAVSEAGNDTWYRIHLPCRGRETCAGWIAGQNGGTEFSKTKPNDFQLGVVGTGTEGLKVRKTVGGPVIGKVWDGQRFSPNGIIKQPDEKCRSNWHKVHMPASSGSKTGWVCGDYAYITK